MSLFGDSGKTEVNTGKTVTLSQPDYNDAEDAKAAANTAKLEKLVGRIVRNLASRGYTLKSIGLNPCYQPARKVFESLSDKPYDAASCFKFLPNEVIGKIGSELDVRDLNSMRLVSMRFNVAVSFEFGKKIKVTENVTIYPTFASMSSFLVGLGLDRTYPATVRTITLVGEGPKTPELSYDISWIHMMSAHRDPNRSALDSSNPSEAQKIRDTDRRIVLSVNDKHEEWDRINKPFCHSGKYRQMLSIVLSRLPNLKTIVIRNLHAGEHIPGWEGPEALKKLSYYRPDLPINEVYYGDWQYDILHKRVTMYTDEYGEYIEENNAGPQAGFIEDVFAAMQLSGTMARIV